MRTLVTLRLPGGAPRRLVAVGERWEVPDGPIDADLGTDRLWALSGLADAHAHLAQDELVTEPGEPAAIRRRAFTYLERGVFLALDKGWSDESVLTLLDEPPSRRPDLQAAGRMIAPRGGYFSGFGDEVEPDALVRAVADAARRSAGWVKLVGDWPRKGRGPLANYPEESLAAAVQVAHAAGARVALHTMAPEVPGAAVRAGVDSIEHGLFLTDDDLRELGRRGGAWVPTVLRVEAVIGLLGPSSSGGRLLAEGLERVATLLPSAGRAGVAVLAGSDLAVPPGKIAEEALGLARLGLTTEQAIASVSEDAWRYAGLPAGFAPGLPADAVFFATDPREDLSALQRPAVVLRRGRVLADRR